MNGSRESGFGLLLVIADGYSVGMFVVLVYWFLLAVIGMWMRQEGTIVPVCLCSSVWL